jgi:hypothetical protein
MLDKIVDGIVEKLKEAFPDVLKIYTEQVKQGFTEPCFVVNLVNPTNTQFLGNRHYRTNLFSVQYFPESGADAKTECYSVQDALFQSLEYINVGDDLQRGTGMTGNFVDGVLVFNVNYNMYVYSEPEFDPMETLRVENEARG